MTALDEGPVDDAQEGDPRELSTAELEAIDPPPNGQERPNKVFAAPDTALIDDLVDGAFRDEPAGVQEQIRLLVNRRDLTEPERRARMPGILAGATIADQDKWSRDDAVKAARTTGQDLGRVDLGPVVRGDTPPIEPGIIYRDDDVGLLYPGSLHDVHGEPGHGKSLFALACCVAVLNTGGAVAYLDFEGVANTFVQRLRALGVTDEVIADPARIVYFNPFGRVDQTAIAQLNAELADTALVIVDAFLPALIRNGGDENSNRDAAAWYETVARPLTAGGERTVVVLDHVSKDIATRVRGARGGGAKLQLVDVSYLLTQVEPFSRKKAGRFTVKVAKDRHGIFAIGETVAEVDVDPYADGAHLELGVRAGTGKPTILMTRVAEFLAAQSDPTSARIVEKEVQGKASGLRWALKCLVESDHLDHTSDGYVLVRPFPDPEPEHD